MRLKLIEVVQFPHEIHRFLQTRDIFEQGIKYALRFCHKLGHLAAQILLNMDLSLASFLHEVLEISLHFTDNLLESVTICSRETGCDLASGDQICLEYFEILAEASDFFVDCLGLNLVHDLHGLNLDICTLWMLLVLSIHLASQLILIEAVLVTKTPN